MNSVIERIAKCLAIGIVAQLLLTAPALAALKLYYDPDTGNVSFDTAETRSGSVYVYALTINIRNPPWLF